MITVIFVLNGDRRNRCIIRIKRIFELCKEFTNQGIFAFGRHLIIKFLKDPEENRVDRILTFSAIEDFSEEEFEDEDVEAGVNVIDSLVGLDEYPETGSVRYVVHTDLREIIFRTKEKPKIEDV